MLKLCAARVDGRVELLGLKIIKSGADQGRFHGLCVLLYPLPLCRDRRVFVFRRAGAEDLQKRFGDVVIGLDLRDRVLCVLLNFLDPGRQAVEFAVARIFVLAVQNGKDLSQGGGAVVELVSNGVGNRSPAEAGQGGIGLRVFPGAFPRCLGRGRVLLFCSFRRCY